MLYRNGHPVIESTVPPRLVCSAQDCGVLHRCRLMGLEFAERQGGGLCTVRTPSVMKLAVSPFLPIPTGVSGVYNLWSHPMPY